MPARRTQVLGLRYTRYIGLAKTNLLHVLTAVALNVCRLASWLNGEPIPKIRVPQSAALAPS